MNSTEIRSILRSPYNRENWKNLYRNIFQNKVTFHEEPYQYNVNEDIVESLFQIGYATLDDEYIVALFEVNIKTDVNLHSKKIGLRKIISKYISDDKFNGVLTIFENGSSDYRFTFASKITKITEEGIVVSETASKRYTYILGENEPCLTPAQRFDSLLKKNGSINIDDIKDAFSVDKLNKEFFNGYKEHYEIICNFLYSSKYKIDVFDDDDKLIRDFVKKFLGRIVFLYFVQKKGWLGVTDKNNYGTGDHQFLSNLFKSYENKKVFYSNVLSKIFFEYLSVERKNDLVNLIPGNSFRIPYLNGGLFEKELIDDSEINFNESDLESLFNFFDRFNFTIYEDDPNEQTVAVDPEMLGHIFENLLEDNKDKGAFYTPKEIVHYMCQESLIEYLTTWFRNKGYQITGFSSIVLPEEKLIFPVNEGRIGQLILESNSSEQIKSIDRSLIENLLKKTLDDNDKNLVIEHLSEFHTSLDTVKICDPSIGSGAFPMGLLQEIYLTKQTLWNFEFGNLNNFPSSEIKTNIIQNSIYGVDIEKGAVDIARLRFWLSLIVDEDEPKSLPNLDFKIVVGNSLTSLFENELIEIDWDIKFKNVDSIKKLILDQQNKLYQLDHSQHLYFQSYTDKDILSKKIKKLKIDILKNQLQLTKIYFNENNPTLGGFIPTEREIKKNEFNKSYLDKIDYIISKLELLKKDDNSRLNYFDWRLNFPEIFNNKLTENPGFDIVIGNPPYVSAVTMARDEAIKVYFKEKYPLATGSYDLYLLFLLKATQLTSSNGVYTWIIPNKFLIADYAKKTKSELIENFGLKYSINVSNFNVFDGIGVYPIIIFGSKSQKSSFQELLLEQYKDLTSRIFASPLKLKSHKTFKDFGIEINSGATGFQAQQLKEIVSNVSTLGSIPFSVSGNIDRYKWTNSSVRYMGDNYNVAFINNSTNVVANSKWNFWNNPKIVIAGMTKVIESVYVDIPLGLGVGVYGIYNFGGFDPYCLTSILNSKYLTYYFLIKFKDKHLAGGYLAINKSTIQEFPLVEIPKETQQKLSDISKKVHELVKQGKSTNSYEEQINFIVYKLYNLSYDEVRLVDPDFILNENEYNSLKELKF